MQHSIKKIIATVLIYLRVFLSYIVPKKRGFLVFRSQEKFSGNIKALILHADQHHKEVKTTLVTTNKSVIKEAKHNGLRAEHIYFWKGFWAVLRAEYIIIDTNLKKFKWGNFSLIQLCHGSGLKNIGLLNNALSDMEKKYWGKLYKKYKLVIATSTCDLEKLNASFGVDTTAVTGYPRNDVFFKGESYDKKLREKYGVENYNKVIAYAPTFRDIKTIPAFTERFWEKLHDYLVKNNTLFAVKKHHLEEHLKVPVEFENIRDLTREVSDTQELLLISDMLITDYSSIATDYALTSMPILIYAYDFDQYKQKCRSVYYDLEEVLPKPFITNEHDLLEKIKDEAWLNDLEVSKSYEDFKNKFHYYLDGNSSERVLQEILRL